MKCFQVWVLLAFRLWHYLPSTSWKVLREVPPEMGGCDYPCSLNVELGLFFFSKRLFLALCRPGSLPFPFAIITAIKANVKCLEDKAAGSSS